MENKLHYILSKSLVFMFLYFLEIIVSSFLENSGPPLSNRQEKNHYFESQVRGFVQLHVLRRSIRVELFSVPEPFYTSSTYPPSSPFYNKNQFFKEKRVMKGG
jgi:hypothetical protein